MSELGIYDINYIEQMTLCEFNYRMYALEYERLKEEYNIYKLAFAIRDAEATKEVGTGKNKKEEYRFNSVNDILDYEKNVKRLNKGKPIELENPEKNDRNDKPSLDVLKQIKNHNKK
ncbi:hypothetical protein [Staphylococcus pseudoxylosus]|uniref:hypothetical protein n=1 Tax=Staphylococcus pseudoxylosus TaxID=2282419 RepID=UPI002DB6F840|nr:hypothetical protein [Staphylococcus pseudoxylosus]MEB7753284.1 hypothetical protein [Staphylococcus pseudoxylosus]